MRERESGTIRKKKKTMRKCNRTAKQDRCKKDFEERMTSEGVINIPHAANDNAA